MHGIYTQTQCSYIHLLLKQPANPLFENQTLNIHKGKFLYLYISSNKATTSIFTTLSNRISNMYYIGTYFTIHSNALGLRELPRYDLAVNSMKQCGKARDKSLDFTTKIIRSSLKKLFAYFFTCRRKSTTIVLLYFHTTL